MSNASIRSFALKKIFLEINKMYVFELTLQFKLQTNNLKTLIDLQTLKTVSN